MMTNVRFGAIHLKSFNFQEPEKITTTTTTRQSDKGQKEVKTHVEEKPLSLKLTVRPEDKSDLIFKSILGLRPSDQPDRDVNIALTTENGKLKLTSSYQYREEYTDYETRSYPVRYIQAGEEVAPYCYASKSEWEYETERIPVQRMRTQTASDTVTVDNQNAFTDLYRLLSDLSDKNPKVGAALKHIEVAGKPFINGAKEVIQKEAESKLEQLRAQLAALEKQTRQKFQK